MEVFDNRFGSHRDKSLLKADWKITLQSVPPASFQIQQARSRRPVSYTHLVTGWTKIAVPEISAIMIPAYQEGQIASRKLIEMIESKNSISNKKVIIKNAVRWRDSTL